MSPDGELDAAEEAALAACYATAGALVSLLELVRPFVDQRANEDVRFAVLAQQVRLALLPGGGTPVTIGAQLAELGGE